MPRKDVTIDNTVLDLPEDGVSYSEVDAGQGPIYLDYNATTPILPEIQNVMNRSFQQAWANPSSTGHELGRQSRAWLDWSRNQIGKLLNASSQEKEIIFTSGGTECNNWVLNHMASVRTNSEGPPHVVTSAIEHPAILQPLKALSNSELLTYTLVEPNPATGSVGVSEISSAIKENTVLVSVMAANNETGVIQPVEAIGQLVREVNQARRLESQQAAQQTAGTNDGSNDGSSGTGPGGSPQPPIKTFVPLFYHVDAAQIIGKGVTGPGQVDVQSWFAHYVTVVGHKFYGPRIGALYVKNGIPLSPWLHGGGQEAGKRSGTENVFDCVGLGAAAQISHTNRSKIGNRLLALRIYLERKLLEAFEGEESSTTTNRCGTENSNNHSATLTVGDQTDAVLATSASSLTLVSSQVSPSSSKAEIGDPHPPVKINFQASKRLPNTVNVAFMTIPEGKTSADLVRRISEKLVVATGAACGHKKDGDSQVCLGSPVLMASGLDELTASKSVRISLGRETTPPMLDRAVEVIKAGIAELANE